MIYGADNINADSVHVLFDEPHPKITSQDPISWSCFKGRNVSYTFCAKQYEQVTSHKMSHPM